MEFDELMAGFARNNGMEQLESQQGKYLIPMEGVDVLCFTEGRKVCLQANLAPASRATGQRGADNRLLLEKSLGVIKAQRVSLTLDDRSEQYQLYQRLPLANIKIGEFQGTVETFAGCCLYYLSLLKPGAGSVSSGGSMMP